MVLARRIKGFKRLRLAQPSQRLRSVCAQPASLCSRALAYTSRKPIFMRQARADCRCERCSQCMAAACLAVQPWGFLRMPHIKPLRVSLSLSPKTSVTAWGWLRHSLVRTSSMAWPARATT